MLIKSGIHFQYYLCYTIYEVFVLVISLIVFPSQFVDYVMTCETGKMPCNFDYAQQLNIFHTVDLNIVISSSSNGCALYF